MKTLLAILMSFIVTEAPVLAIHGGYTLGGAEQATGTYAGVLVPISLTELNAGATFDFGTNSLGLFTLNIPSNGIGNGSVVIFSGPSQAQGSIDALPDPNNIGGIVGVLQATAYAQVFQANVGGVGLISEEEETSQASGSLTCSQSIAGSSDETNSPTGIDLTGSSNVTFSVANGDVFFNGTNLIPAQQVEYSVEGFQQSATATQTTGTF
jgi:hypothetical protein